MIRSRTPVDEGGRRAAKPHRAVARERGEQHHAERERQPGRRVSVRSSVSTAGLANTATAMKVRPQMPISAALCASTSGPVSA